MCEANKMRVAAAAAAGEGPRPWGPKKWQLKGCRKERSRSGQKSRIETNARPGGCWWVYAAGMGRVEEESRSSSRGYRWLL